MTDSEDGVEFSHHINEKNPLFGLPKYKEQKLAKHRWSPYTSSPIFQSCKQKQMSLRPEEMDTQLISNLQDSVTLVKR